MNLFPLVQANSPATGVASSEHTTKMMGCHFHYSINPLFSNSWPASLAVLCSSPPLYISLVFARCPHLTIVFFFPCWSTCINVQCIHLAKEPVTRTIEEQAAPFFIGQYFLQVFPNTWLTETSKAVQILWKLDCPVYLGGSPRRNEYDCMNMGHALQNWM